MSDSAKGVGNSQGNDHVLFRRGNGPAPDALHLVTARKSDRYVQSQDISSVPNSASGGGDGWWETENRPSEQSGQGASAQSFPFSISDSAFRIIGARKSNDSSNLSSSVPGLIGTGDHKHILDTPSTKASTNPTGRVAFPDTDGQLSQRQFARTPGAPDWDKFVSDLVESSPSVDKASSRLFPSDEFDSPDTNRKFEQYVSSLLQSDTPVALRDANWDDEDDDVTSNLSDSFSRHAIAPADNVRFSQTWPVQHHAEGRWNGQQQLPVGRLFGEENDSSRNIPATVAVEKKKAPEVASASHMYSAPQYDLLSTTAWRASDNRPAVATDGLRVGREFYPQSHPHHQTAAAAAAAAAVASAPAPSSSAAVAPAGREPTLPARAWGRASYQLPLQESSTPKTAPAVVSMSLDTGVSNRVSSLDPTAGPFAKPPSGSSVSRSSRLPLPVKPLANNTNDLRTSTDSLRSSASTVRTAVPAPITPTVVSLHAAPQDYVESPRSKSYFRDFQAAMRQVLKDDPDHVDDKMTAKLVGVPEHSRWHCYLELAEHAKKKNDYDKAREYYILACCSERRAPSAWIEWSKMEEENGHPDKATRILTLALIICKKVNDALVLRLIRLRERQHEYRSIRGVLSVLKYEPLDKSWKSILEGSLFEARLGNVDTTRDNLKFLMVHVPWYGPLYQEAYRLEEREGKDTEALQIIRRGLTELPRYGPLWFGAFHIQERRDVSSEVGRRYQGYLPNLVNSYHDCRTAAGFISKELIWRVYFEQFGIERRAMEQSTQGVFWKQPRRKSLAAVRQQLGTVCRKSLAQTLLWCPLNLRWKVLVVSARYELLLGQERVARQLLSKAYAEIPKKSLSAVIIESSRLEEYLGNITVARTILKKARAEISNDWRVALEQIMLEYRQGHIKKALKYGRTAVLAFPCTGRVWALLIQLYHRWEGTRSCLGCDRYLADPVYGIFLSASQSIETLQRFSPREVVLRNAIAEVPKSGEVWCEEGRGRLNPLLLGEFDVSLAQQALSFALQFTPQFGDSLIELMRLELVVRGCLRAVCHLTGLDYVKFIKSFLIHDLDCDLVQDLHNDAKRDSIASFSALSSSDSDDRVASLINLLSLTQELPREVFVDLELVEFEQLHRRCLNADPNYGLLWVHGKDLPGEVPARVLARAQQHLVHELSACYPLYLRAMLLFVERVLDRELMEYRLAADAGRGGGVQGKDVYLSSVHPFINDDGDCEAVEVLLRDISAARGRIGQSEDVDDIPVHLVYQLHTGQTFCLEDFVTGSVAVNRNVISGKLEAEERWEYLFATDNVV